MMPSLETAAVVPSSEDEGQLLQKKSLLLKKNSLKKVSISSVASTTVNLIIEKDLEIQNLSGTNSSSPSTTSK